MRPDPRNKDDIPSLSIKPPPSFAQRKYSFLSAAKSLGGGKVFSLCKDEFLSRSFASPHLIF